MAGPESHAASSQDGLLLSNPTFTPMSSSSSLANSVQSLRLGFQDLSATMKRSDTARSLQHQQHRSELHQQKDQLQPTMSIAFDRPPLSLPYLPAEEQHAPSAGPAAATTAAVQFDEFSLSKIFYGVWSADHSEEMTSATFLNTILGPVDSSITAFPTGSTPIKQGHGPAVLDDLLKQGFFYRVLELLQLQKGPELQVQALNIMGHILEDRRISPKPALRKGLSGTLLQLLNNSADAVHLQCTVVVIGRLARDKNCRDDMIAQGVLQALITKLEKLEYDTATAIICSRAMSRLCTTASDAYYLNLSVYNIRAAVDMFSNLFQDHRSSSSAVKYATRALYNMALCLAKPVQRDFNSAVFTSPIYDVMIDVLCQATCLDTADHVMRCWTLLAGPSGLAQDMLSRGALAVVLRSLDAVPLQASTNYDDSLRRLLFSQNGLQLGVAQVVETCSKTCSARAAFKLGQIVECNTSIADSDKLYAAVKFAMKLSRRGGTDEAGTQQLLEQLLEAGAVGLLLNALIKRPDQRDWAAAKHLLVGMESLLRMAARSTTPALSVAKVLGGAEGIEVILSLTKYHDLDSIRDEDYAAMTRTAKRIQDTCFADLPQAESMAQADSSSIAAAFPAVFEDSALHAVPILPTWSSDVPDALQLHLHFGDEAVDPEAPVMCSSIAEVKFESELQGS